MKKALLLLLTGEERELNSIQFSDKLTVVKGTMLEPEKNELGEHTSNNLSLSDIDMFINNTILTILTALGLFCTDHLSATDNKIISERIQKLLATK